MAEVRKRGADFWDEFEFYLSDLVVGCVLDVVLVSLMAPTATLGARKATTHSGVPSAAAATPQPPRFRPLPLPIYSGGVLVCTAAPNPGLVFTAVVLYLEVGNGWWWCEAAGQATATCDC